MCTDSLLSYKATFCYSFGSVTMTVLKMVYRDPRPYWTNMDIQLPENMCDLSYGNPTQATFNFTFFFTYSSYMQLYRYVPKH